MTISSLVVFAVFATILLRQPKAAGAVVVDEKPLFFQQLDYFAACGDGSPAGIYTDFDAEDDRTNHIISFQGGGGCVSEASCRLIGLQKPYFFSSLYEPESITGHTIVSNDPLENPLESFVKWMVPYCSQDMWLGSGMNSSGFTRSGSAHVDAVLLHWLDAVSGMNTTTVDTLVVNGVSAGTVAVLNHVDQIREVAKAAGIQHLRLIVDASLFSDRFDLDLSPLLKVVDPETHPLCFENPENTLNKNEYLSQLPCCLSTHCMLRHSPSLRDITSMTPSKDERLMLIDTTYDVLQAFTYLTSHSAPSNAHGNGMMGLTGLSSSIFNIGEFGGKRKERVLETLFAGEHQVGPNVLWVMPSAMLHTILIPSNEISSRICNEIQTVETVEECESGGSDCVFTKLPYGIVNRCNASGVGMTAEISGLKMTAWTTTDTWKRVTVNGMPIRDIISDFVLNSTDDFNTLQATLLIDSCPGPNCVPEGQQGGNPVQSLIEIENTFSVIPIWSIALVSIVLYSIVIVYFFMAYSKDNSKDSKQDNNKDSKQDNNKDSKQDNNKDSKQQLSKGLKSKRLLRVNTTRSLQKDICLRGLCVESNTGSKILEDVDLRLKHSTLNCLLGKSGSGKSTLLSVLSFQLKSNLNVSLKSTSDISSISCTFMRQLDLGTMENMTPIDYLHSTSKIFGADQENLDFVLDLVQPFFPIKTKLDENNVEVTQLDPFQNANIRELSGGQRRMLAIAAALFQNSNLLLLDEPLSGLDSVSSMKVIKLLKFIAQENAVTVFMTLHQPSNEILDEMDGVVVLDNGKKLFDNRTDSLGDDASSAEFIHELLRESTIGIPKKGDSSLWVTESTRSNVSNHPRNHKLQKMKSQKITTMTTLSNYFKDFRLWQVQPLIRRLHLEHRLTPQDVLVVPFCFLILSAWGSIDATNPFVTFLLTNIFVTAPTVLNQVVIVVNWRVLSAHLWDLEDKRISPLSYLLASGFRMMYVPIFTTTISLAIGYAVMGWNWEAFWTQNLLIILTTISLLQFCKTISAVMPTLEAVSVVFNLAGFVGFILSGLLVNPSKVPSSIQWLMYLSPFFWSMSGNLLIMFEHSELGEQPCQSLAACILYNPSFLAHATGFGSLVTVRTSFFVLVGVIFVLVVIEYFLLCRKVVQRSNYKTLDDVEKEKKDDVIEESKNLKEDDMSDSSDIEFRYESTRSNTTYVVRREHF